MSEGPLPESIIAVDLGNTLTHVCLLDLVEGEYRFVAHAEEPTTAKPPESDITLGLLRAIRQIEYVAQRRLLDGDMPLTPERDSGEGFDALVASASAAPALCCLLLAMTDDISLATARRACLSSHATIVGSLCLGAAQNRWTTELVDILRNTPPDAIIMVGGTDRGPTEMLVSAAEALATIYADIEPQERPIVLYAANQEARRSCAAAVEGLLEYRVVDNARPSLQTENPGELQRELADAYVQRKIASLPGYRRLREWCALPVTSTLDALGTTWRFMARRDDLRQGVMGLDVGGHSTAVAAAQGTQYHWAVGAGIGTGAGIRRALRRSGLKNIYRWLASPLNEDQILQQLENMALRPYGIPQTKEDLLIVHAVVRQAALLTMRRMRQQHWRTTSKACDIGVTPPFDLVAARGGALASTSCDGLVALTVLDALQPTGLTRLVVDWASIWPQLGLVARLAPMAATQVLESDSMRDLGVLVAPIGEARDGAPALHLILRLDDGTTIEDDIRCGEIRRYPLAIDQEAELEVHPSRFFDIGLDRKGLGGRTRVRGGALGVVVDARGRPLSLPQVPAVRRARLRAWYAALSSQEDTP